MKKTAAAILAGAVITGAASPASALGLKYGVRAGTGITFPDQDPAPKEDPSVFAAGLGLLLDLAIIGVEVDALYLKHSGENDSSASYIAVPALGRFNFPIIPAFLSLDFFAGLEYRLGIGLDGGKGVGELDDHQKNPLYLPIGIGGTLDLKIIQLNLDMRYERQLTAHNDFDEDARIHELLFMAGAFF